jgi:hypothetical protein
MEQSENRNEIRLKNYSDKFLLCGTDYPTIHFIALSKQSSYGLIIVGFFISTKQQ